MVARAKYEEIKAKVINILNDNSIAITAEESANIEVADLGLNEVETTGLQIITYINTDRVCAKEIILLPGQTCPEHMHPTIEGNPGKEETFRCRAGVVYLYVPGEKTENPACSPPESSSKHYTAFREIILRPGEQYTLYPDTLHWFQAGAEGAVVSEFSTRSTDEADIFTDPRIVREAVVE